MNSSKLVYLQAALQNIHIWSTLLFICITQYLMSLCLWLKVLHHLVLFTLFFCFSSVRFCSERFVNTDTHVCSHKELGQLESAALQAQFSKILIKKELSSTYCSLITSDCEIESHGSSKWVITLMNPLEQSLSNFTKHNFPFQLWTQAPFQNFSITVYLSTLTAKNENSSSCHSKPVWQNTHTHSKKRILKNVWVQTPFCVCADSPCNVHVQQQRLGCLNKKSTR